MKKLLIILVLALCGIAAKSQIVYQPFIPERNPEPAYTSPTYTSPSYNYVPRPTRPVQSSVSIVSEQILIFDTYDVKSDIICECQVKCTTWSNGRVDLVLVGLKPHQNWISMNLGVVSIGSLLSNSNLDDNAKEFLLTCSELAEGIAFDDDNCYLIGLRQ